MSTSAERQRALRKRRAAAGLKELRNIWLTDNQDAILRAKIMEWLKEIKKETPDRVL
jgi:hypothetical protein